MAAVIASTDPTLTRWNGS
jgi:hypothetical protein